MHVGTVQAKPHRSGSGYPKKANTALKPFAFAQVNPLFTGGHTAQTQRTVKALKARASEIQALEQVYQLLIWDTETAMPKAAANARAHQLVSQAVVLHQKQTHAGLGELLMRLQQPQVLTTLAPLDQALVVGIAFTQCN
jgi:hypothetical protein